MALALGFWGKSWWILKIVGVIYLFGVLALAIIDGAVMYYKTGEAKPLLDATVGKIAASDSAIGEDVDKLKDSEHLDKRYVDYLKSDIIQNLAIFLFMWYLLYKFFDLFRQMGLSDEQTNMWVKIMLVIFSFIVLTALNIIYTKMTYNVWSYPFQGIGNLVSNLEVVSGAVGTYNQPYLINETINTTKSIIM